MKVFGIIFLFIAGQSSIGSVPENKNTDRARELGLVPGPAPATNDIYSPYLRKIHQGEDKPLAIRACFETKLIVDAGKKEAMGPWRELDANPYAYLGLKLEWGPIVTDQTPDELPAKPTAEYIEAGLGFPPSSSGIRNLFRPYIRRAPDDLDIYAVMDQDGGAPSDKKISEPPSKWERILRPSTGQLLPGYWAVKGSEKSEMMDLSGKICISFAFLEEQNIYRFQYEITNVIEGKIEKIYRLVEMPSTRQLVSRIATKSKLRSTQARLLTSVAISRLDYSPEDPRLANLAFGVDWKAQILDPSLGAAWSFFAAPENKRFRTENGDSRGNVIFYQLRDLPSAEMPKWMDTF